MTEADLKSALVTVMRAELPKFEIFRHEDRATFGVPDLSVTGFGWTSWWEVKHATPNFETQGVQAVTVSKLNIAGYARYIIYREIGHEKHVIIARPDHVFKLHTGQRVDLWTTLPRIPHFNHRYIAKHIRDVHAAFMRRTIGGLDGTVHHDLHRSQS